MLDYIKNGLETILGGLDATLTVTMQKVNSLEKGANKPEPNLVQCVYRELPSMLPKSAVPDRIIRGEMVIVALEEKKEIIDEAFSTFLSTYQATYNTDRMYYFSNLIPIGQADNIGAKTYQKWHLSVDVQIISNLSTIRDVAVVIGGITLNYQNGLIAFDAVKSQEVATRPINQTERLLPIYQTLTITFRMLDIDDPFCDLIKSYIYAATPQVACTVTDGAEALTFSARITEIVKSAKDEAYSTILVTLRRA